MANKQTQEIIRQITDHYDASVARLRDALTAYLKDRTLPDMADRAIGAFAYPELVIRYHGTQRGNVANLAFGRLEKPGTYCITLTRPEIFKDYLESQIDLLVDQYELEMHVRPGKQEIPFPYVLDGLELGDVSPTELSKWFPA
ncbi:MAG: AMP nucleosidase, partial [Pseudomonadota bacterium]